MWATLRTGFDGGFDRLRPHRRPAGLDLGRFGTILLGLGIVCGLSLLAFMEEETGRLMVIGSFGATSVIVFTLPDSDYAQPWNVIVGHGLATAIGLIGFRLGGGAWWSIGPTVAVAFWVMVVTDSLHPPAGADPIIMVSRHATDLGFLTGTVLIGTVVLVVVAVFWHAAVSGRRYPDAATAEAEAERPRRPHPTPGGDAP
jgi:CBS-domain-containing membrane protein